MKRQFARLQYGQGMELPPLSKNPGAEHPEIVVPFARVPKVGLDLAGAVSLFAGLFLAFFLEYWQRITRERAEGARPAAP